MKASSRIQALEDALSASGYAAKVLRDAPIAPYTTLNIGGPADLLIIAERREDLIQAVRHAQEGAVPYTVLGGGSNVLVADAGIRGLVIINATSEVAILEDGCIVADSGVPLAEIADQSIDEGLAGLAWAIGVPGSLGGAVVGNAGAYGGCMADIVHEIEVLFPSGETASITNRELGYAYRTSMLKRIRERCQRPIVTRIVLQLTPGLSAELREQASSYTIKRMTRTPRGRSAGSIFKRTIQYPAGYLIDQAGLKGFRIGDAEVSPVHANFLMNVGNATAQDMRMLIAHVQAVVWRAFAQRLETEVEFVGDWPDEEED